MELSLKIKMNDKLFVRDPQESLIGKRIVLFGAKLINELGFEDFTFKKLATEIETTEATIYRYFENKHRLLIYLNAWYWSYLEYKIIFTTNNISNPETKLKQIIYLLANPEQEFFNSDEVNAKDIYNIVMWEGSKTYLTKHVDADNKDKLFKPFKDLCNRFANTIIEFNPKYKYAHSLASTIIEISHSQKFFMLNLPSLTDFSNDKDNKKLIQFLESILFSSIKN